MSAEHVQSALVRTSLRASDLSSLPERASAAVETTVDLAKFGLLLIEAVGLACIVSRYRLESDAFLDLFVLAVVGFVIQHVLPLALHEGFLILSLLGIVAILEVSPGGFAGSPGCEQLRRRKRMMIGSGT